MQRIALLFLRAEKNFLIPGRPLRGGSCQTFRTARGDEAGKERQTGQSGDQRDDDDSRAGIAPSQQA